MIDRNEGIIRNIAFINIIAPAVTSQTALINNNLGIIENLYVDYVLTTSTYTSDYNGVIATLANNPASDALPSEIRNCIVNVRLADGATLPPNQGSIVGRAGGWYGFVKNCYAITNYTGISNIYVCEGAAGVGDYAAGTSAQFNSYYEAVASADVSMYDSSIWSFTETTISFFGNVVYEAPEPHVCEYEWTTLTPATCTEAEVLKGVCACGEETTKAGEPALGHKYELVYEYGYKASKCACGQAESMEAWLTHTVTQNISNVEITKGEGTFTITFTVAKGWSGLHLFYDGQELTPDNVEEGYEVYPNDCSLGVYWSEGSWFVYSSEEAQYTVIYTVEGSVLSQPEPEIVPGFSYKVVQNITNVEGVEQDGVVTITFTASGVWCGLHLYYDGIELTVNDVVVGEGVSATYAACIYWDGDTNSWFLQNTKGNDAVYTLIYNLSSKTLAQPHQYGSWQEAVAPTCTTAGSKGHYVCELCGGAFDAEYNAMADVVVPANGHTEVVDQAVAPTCTAKGLTEGKHCSVCNEVLVAQEEVAANGHTNSEAVVENNVAPTCTEAGSYDSVVYCSVCGVEVSREAKEAAALGHTEVVDQAVAPTCTQGGKTEGKHCSVCDEVLVAQQVVAAKGHSYNDGIVTKEPTTEEAGERTYSCECGDSYTEEIAKLDKEPTDTPSGDEPNEKPATNGCGGSVLASLFGLIALASATIVLRKKREE